jgi:hypothetical protein
MCARVMGSDISPKERRRRCQRKGKEKRKEEKDWRNEEK